MRWLYSPTLRVFGAGYHHAGLIGLLLGSHLPAPGQAGPSAHPTLDNWSGLIQQYAHTHDPQLLAKTLAYARGATPAEQHLLLHNQGGMLGFYATWLAAHPAERPAFRRQLGQVAGTPAWRTLLRRLAEPAVATRPPGTGASPAHNDFLWGAYFATAQPRYLDSLIAQARYLSPHPGPGYRQQWRHGIGWSALWSLQATARQDSAVAAYLAAPPARQQLARRLGRYQGPNTAPALQALVQVLLAPSQP